jgi:bacterioferritin-associated ferredoxin
MMMDSTNKTLFVTVAERLKEKIKALIEDDITDLDSISRRTGVCSGCGACENLILKLIAEYS